MLNVTNLQNLTPVRMAIINGTKQNKTNEQRKQVLLRMWRNWNSFALLVGMQNGVAAMKNSMEGPQEIKTRTTI